MTLPEDFERSISPLLGLAGYEQLVRSLAEEPTVSIRLNREKMGMADVSEHWSDGVVEWFPGEGRYLKARPQFTFDPLLHAGCYYVQEASSMFLGQVLRQMVRKPVLMGDFCAAPGGKSTVARQSLPAGSLLIANEPNRTRAQILAENMQKWGHEDVIVTNNYPRDIARSGLVFDVILCDVPCSGEGMFRKDAVAVAEWSLQHVEKCRQLQREIVAEAWKCLQAGGLLVYSTCTFNVRENEENVRWACQELGAEPQQIALEPQWGIAGSLLEADFDAPVYRFLPGKTRGEGLFMAVLRKPEEAERLTMAKPPRSKQAAMAVGNWVNGSDNYQTWVAGQQQWAVPRRWFDVLQTVSRHLHVLSAGVSMAVVKGKDLVPTAALALSRSLNRDAFPQAELGYGDAMAFLRKETITLSAGSERGFVLVKFGGHPLGFVKNLGNRANNLFPQEWKIKTTHIPQDYETIFRPAQPHIDGGQ